MHSLSGRHTPTRKRKWPKIILVLLGIYLLVEFFGAGFDTRLRMQLRILTEDLFPKQADLYHQSMGLSRYAGEDDQGVQSPRQPFPVILIHGLDEPGKVWMNLAPELHRHGYEVWIMNYPNDQSVTRSSLLFFEQLQKLAQKGISTVSIVAHSMGGLVTREVLTNPEFSYRQLARNNQLPKIAHFIMVGTPNHGSHLVRMRFFLEIREQFVRFVEGNGSVLTGIFDGAGEAKADLLPGSHFLTELNSRPHPKSLDPLIIAGSAVPWHLTDTVQRQSPVQRYGRLIAQKVGDGLITAASSGLPGVERRTVPGTHLSVIRNFIQKSTRTPPAIPIIMKRLADQQL